MHVAQALLRFVPIFSAQPMLHRVRAPTLLLTPGFSNHTDTEEQQEILDTISNSRQIRYPDAKHIDCYLRPDGFARDTRDFLHEVNQRGQSRQG